MSTQHRAIYDIIQSLGYDESGVLEEQIYEVEDLGLLYKIYGIALACEDEDSFKELIGTYLDM